jgi:response regulator RpfG family c-di-GMP phosphodiesterase
MDDALAGIRVLIAGGSATAVKALRGQLVGGAAKAAAAGDAEAAAAAVETDPPDVIVALAGTESALRELLDPLRLRSGPPVIAAAALAVEDSDDMTVLRLRALLDRSALERRVSELEAALASLTVARRRDVDTVRLDLLRRLALAAEYRDDNTREHTERVAGLAARLGAHLGLSEGAVSRIRYAAPLHDVGKIAVPDSILLKPGRLDPEEFEVVKTHAEAGARVLADSDSELFEVAEHIARFHHERWDGTGYPDGLVGEDIPLAGRLVHVADVFDVLVNERPYKESWSIEDAAEEIRRGAGTQFDPEVVEAFVDLGARAWQAAPGVYGG